MTSHTSSLQSQTGANNTWIQAQYAILTSQESALVDDSTYSSPLFTINITPTSSSSVILILFSVTASYTTSVTNIWVTLKRGGSNLIVGSPGGSQTAVTTGFSSAGNSAGACGGCTYAYLDSPASTSQLTYTLLLSGNQSSTELLQVNQSPYTTSGSATFKTYVSNMTCLEILPNS